MELILHCFGASTTSGEALHNLAQKNLVGYSRKPLSSSGWKHQADLIDPASFQPAAKPDATSIWISFAPIWLLAPFLDELASHHPERLQGLRGVIACSSSSAITKRFSSNRFDRELVAKLTSAEDQLLATCRQLSLPCRILRPTMIYGQVGAYGDHNLSRLSNLLRHLPLVLLPAETGLRQPIHASQLAEVALHLAKQITGKGLDPSLPERIALGGDSTLTYTEMIRALQKSQRSTSPTRRCLLLQIPNRFFFMLSAPIVLISPKTFEAVLRMGTNLSNFTPAHQLLGGEPQPFPVLPLA